MAPKLRSQTRTTTSWSYLPAEIRQMIIIEVARTVCHDATEAFRAGNLPVHDIWKALDFIAYINYEFGQEECLRNLESLGTDLSLQEYFLDEKIYTRDSIIADKGKEDESDSDKELDDESGGGSDDESEDDNDVEQNNEENEDEDMSGANGDEDEAEDEVEVEVEDEVDNADEHMSEDDASEASSDEHEHDGIEKDSTLAALEDDDPKKPLAAAAAEARRARWNERRNYVRQARTIIMHAAEAIDLQRKCRDSIQTK